MPKQQLAIAARAAGVLPLGFIGTVADYKDLDAFRETVRRSRRLGFRGASVIHPAQIPILNEEFAPPAEDVASARKIVAAYDEAVAAGRGSISVDGKMIDVPVVLRAQEVLAIHEAIKEREARTDKDERPPRIRALRHPLCDARGAARGPFHRRRSARRPDADGLFRVGREERGARLRDRLRLHRGDREEAQAHLPARSDRGARSWSASTPTPCRT